MGKVYWFLMLPLDGLCTLHTERVEHMFGAAAGHASHPHII